VGAVPDQIRVGLVGEVLLQGDPAGQVWVGGVDAGVQDRDLHTCAGVAGLPRVRAADLRDAAVQ
jgi:hypothetical protein